MVPIIALHSLLDVRKDGFNGLTIDLMSRDNAAVQDLRLSTSVTTTMNTATRAAVNGLIT